MNAEALIGTVLGTCTLQTLVGQGGMGAVFLAQQSRPRRQVAVKVLLPMTPLNAHQLAAFLERFRRETDAAASLEHPNIIPVHEYGEQDGIAYLVMPYIAGGTLRDELEREGRFSLQKTLNYIEQIGAALDFAHNHGVIHRDIKPANIMITPEGRLLLTDFGLVKIVSLAQSSQKRLTGAGAPIGTPDYMAPEQVIGDDVDPTADLYSLGVILFHLLTGTTPFRGETPMQIAAQHLQVPPPSPQMLRPDLPIAVEQVILRSLAKRPADRYPHAADMIEDYRAALRSSGIAIDTTSLWTGLMSGATASRIAIVKGQFDPMRQTNSLPRVKKNPAPSTSNDKKSLPGIKRSSIITYTPPAPTPPPPTPDIAPRKGGLLSRAGMNLSTQQNRLGPALPTTNHQEDLRTKQPPFSLLGSQANPETQNDTPSSHWKPFPVAVGMQTVPSSWQHEHALPQPVAVPRNSTTSLQIQPMSHIQSVPRPGQTRVLPELHQPGTTVKLNDPVKIVKVPVAGQPGQYVTGLLPFTKSLEETPFQHSRFSPRKVFFLAVIGILLVAVIGTLLFHAHPLAQNTLPTSPGTNSSSSQNNTLTSQAQATATASANIILYDPLNANIHNWRTTPANSYAFKDNAYHITDHGNTPNGIVLPEQSFTGTLSYTLTMQEVNGDDTNSLNAFGMIFRYSQKTTAQKTVSTFYTFEVVNDKKPQYQFWRYDGNNKSNPWTLIKNGTLSAGKEFHTGKGARATNTIKISMRGNQFTITVNGKTLSRVFQDNAFTNGTVGMIVNNNGTEVAYRDLLLTRN